MPLSDRGSERKGPPFKSAETSSKRAPKKKILRDRCGEQEVEEGMREDKRRFFGGASARSLGRCRALARSLRPRRKTFRRQEALLGFTHIMYTALPQK